MGWDDLDSDTKIEILKRMPVETLIRLMSTCKSMLSIITSPTLMISKNPTKTPYHIYSYTTPQGYQEFLLCEGLNKNSIKHQTINGCPIDWINYFLIGYCDGILCFCSSFHSKAQKLVLWNPFLGKVLTLPVLPMRADRYHALGFGFDRSEIDYKVVRIEIKLPSADAPPREYCEIRADVYMLHASTWKDPVVVSTLLKECRIIGQGVFINGVMHWNTMKLNQYCGRNYSILTFNLGTEVFGEFELPKSVGHDSMTLTTLTIHDTEKLVAYNNEHLVCKVWVMEEYGANKSWREICAIDMGLDEYGTVLNAWNDNKIVVSTNKGRLLRYDLETQTQIDIKPLNNHKSSLEYVGPYVESLVFALAPGRLSNVPKLVIQSNERRLCEGQ